jgi:riboflavin kinase/FMN adenylyltransferase
MVEGPNFAFGHDRQGNVTSLHDWCDQSGIDFEVVEETRIDDQLVSSSLIRQFLGEGRVEDAARFLGRPHRLRGVVAKGAGRGAGLGFPTLNLTAIDVLIPADGVYAARAWIKDRGPAWPAACNIGPNPTFGEQVRKVEAHLVGFSADLYGQSVELDFLARLRSTRRFASREELLEQIRADIDQTRRVIGVDR